MALESIIARRYLFGKDKTLLISLLAWVGIFGITIGVFSLIVIQAVMAGFSFDLKKKILRLTPPIVLKAADPAFFSGKQAPTLPSDSNILKMSPFLETEVVAHPVEEDLNQGVKLRGVESDDPIFAGDLKIEFVEGFGLEDLKTKGEELPGVLLGTELAKRLNILPILTEEIELIYPFGEVDPTGEIRPKTRRFRVIGTFKTGYYGYDQKFAVVDLAEARRLVPSREVPTEWGLWIKNVLKAPEVAHALKNRMGDSFQVESWGRRNQKLFAALRLERVAMFLVLSLMIAIASFNIFSLTMMMVVDKAKEIAVFRSMGMKRRAVERIFWRIGMFLGATGTLLGALFGIGTVLYLKWNPLSVPSSYYLDKLPIKIDPVSMALVVLGAPLLTLLASWYPARKGGGFDVAESLRYE